jgi:hypothetical protein
MPCGIARNARTAFFRMRELGAADVDTVNLGPLNHGPAQWPAYIGARKWFGTFPAPAVVDTDEEDEDALAPAGDRQ